MVLDEATCWARLVAARHAVLATIHPDRGVDVVPVVHAVVDRRIIVPVDTVKAKRTTRLRRLANVAADSRCALLVDGWDEDWARLWWVRVHATAVEVAPGPVVLAALADRFPAYAAAGDVATTLELTPTRLTGWAAGGPAGYS